MSGWNHRVFKQVIPAKKIGTVKIPAQVIYSIREAYYHRINSKNPWGWTGEPDAPFGETLEELKQSLVWMLEALDKPVLKDRKPKNKPEVTK